MDRSAAVVRRSLAATSAVAVIGFGLWACAAAIDEEDVATLLAAYEEVAFGDRDGTPAKPGVVYKWTRPIAIAAGERSGDHDALFAAAAARAHARVLLVDSGATLELMLGLAEREFRSRKAALLARPSGDVLAHEPGCVAVVLREGGGIVGAQVLGAAAPSNPPPCASTVLAQTLSGLIFAPRELPVPLDSSGATTFVPPVDPILFRVHADPRLTAGMTREEARPVARAIIRERLQAANR